MPSPPQIVISEWSPNETHYVPPIQPLTEWTGERLLAAINNISGSGAILPQYDFIDVTDRYGSTNNVRTVVFKYLGSQVAHWTLTYINGGVANDDELATATLVIP